MQTGQPITFTSTETVAVRKTEGGTIYSDLRIQGTLHLKNPPNVEE